MADPIFHIGMLFNDGEEFKEAIRNHGIKNRYQPRFKLNIPKKIEAVCKGTVNGKEKFPWKAYASRVDNKDENNHTMRIKSGHFTHQCSKVHKNFNMTYKSIGKKYVESFRSDADWKVQAMIDDIGRVWELGLGRMTAYRAKCHALQIIHGDEKSQYESIYRYRAEILRSNPGSTVMGRWKESKFVGMYVCLNALKMGFKAGCRKLISLDGCWLKGLYGGQLLSAVGIDPNNCIFPIAYAMVETESKETWTWFLELLKDDLEITNSGEWAFMSDRQKGLIAAVQILFPDAEHKMCVRHMYANFRSTFKSKELKDLLWNAARAPYIEKHEAWLSKLEEISLEARDWLRQKPSQQWSRSCFSERAQCDMLLNNLCESFNKYILDTRDKGIITMFEMLKVKLMKRIKTKSDLMKRSNKIWCVKILKKLEANKDWARHFKATFSGGPRVQINGLGEQYVVNLDGRECSCRRWQLIGIPCGHACGAIIAQNETPENFLAECCSIETYLKVYSFIIEPTNGMDQWPQAQPPVPIEPLSPVRTKRGRRIKARRKEAAELEEAAKNGKMRRKGNVYMSCRKCGGKGHNKRSCKSQGTSSSAPQPKRRRNTTNVPCPAQAPNTAPNTGSSQSNPISNVAGHSQISTATQNVEIRIQRHEAPIMRQREDATRKTLLTRSSTTNGARPWR